MSDYTEIISLFQDPEIASRVEALLKATDVISKREPVYGFHHKYYVPGWIGIIQQMIVENKMNKFSSQQFYDDKNYLEYADWLIKLSKEISDLQIKYKPEGEKIDLDYEHKCNTLIKIFNVTFEAWIEACPEIATYCNHEYTENTLISAAGIVQNAFIENLGAIGYVVQPSKSERKFMDEVRGQLYYIAGYIINVLLLGLIFGIGSTIFG